MNEENKNKVLTLLDDVRHQKMEALYWLPSYLEKTMESAEIAYKLGKYDRSIELCFTIINFEKKAFTSILDTFFIIFLLEGDYRNAFRAIDLVYSINSSKSHAFSECEPPVSLFHTGPRVFRMPNEETEHLIDFSKAIEAASNGDLTKLNKLCLELSNNQFYKMPLSEEEIVKIASELFPLIEKRNAPRMFYGYY